jgi:selenoprotein W-related protein
LASRLLGKFKQRISSLELIPSSGGCFELKIDDDLIYSKLKTGEFPDEPKLADLVGKRLAGKQTA